MRDLLEELKRRSVYKITAAYGVVAWLLIQLADVVLPTFAAPLWFNQGLIFVLILGFPLVAVLAWAFDISSNGVQKTPAAPAAPTRLRKRDYLLATVSLVLFAVILAQQAMLFYRAESPPREVTADAPAGVEDRETASLDGDDFKSVAILPFLNLSPDPDNAYFAAGIHQEILSQIAKITDLRVISRTSVLRFQDRNLSIPDIARELQVGAIMEGSVRFANDRVRVTMQLLRADTESSLWSETYEFLFDDIFAIQSDVAQQVANALEASLLPEEIASIQRPATTSPEAYNIYLEHRYRQEQISALITPDEDGYPMAGIRELSRAVDLDPNFAQGLAELAYLTWVSSIVKPIEDYVAVLEEAEALANRALALEPGNTRALTTLGRIAFGRRQWQQSDDYFRRAASGPDPDGRVAFNYAGMSYTAGRFDEAFRWSDAAIRNNSSVAFYREQALHISLFAGEFEKALDDAEAFLAVGGDRNAYHVTRALALNELGRSDEALAAFGRVDSLQMDIQQFWSFGIYTSRLVCEDSFERIARDNGLLDDNFDAQNTIACQIENGDYDAFFAIQFDRADAGMPFTVMHSRLIPDAVRQDPRWQQLVDLMDYPDSTP